MKSNAIQYVEQATNQLIGQISASLAAHTITADLVTNGIEPGLRAYFEQIVERVETDWRRVAVRAVELAVADCTGTLPSPPDERGAVRLVLNFAKLLDEYSARVRRVTPDYVLAAGEIEQYGDEHGVRHAKTLLLRQVQNSLEYPNKLESHGDGGEGYFSYGR